MLGPWEVEQEVIAALRKWFPVYLSQVEYDRGIQAGSLPRPPEPDSYRGSIDGTPWQQDETPTLIVTVEPFGDPERCPAPSGYKQVYEVVVNVVVVEDEGEDVARQRASYYATAAMGALLQNGALSGIAVETRLAAAPRTDFVDPEVRTTVLGSFAAHVDVQPLVNDEMGFASDTPPTGYAPYPYWGTATSVNVDIEEAPISVQFLCSTRRQSSGLTNVFPWPAQIEVGMQLSGAGIRAGTYVQDFQKTQQTITMSADATVDADGVTVSLNAAY